MVRINFGKWNDAGKGRFFYHRILIKGYIWTPFVKTIKRNAHIRSRWAVWG